MGYKEEWRCSSSSSLLPIGGGYKGHLGPRAARRHAMSKSGTKTSDTGVNMVV